MTTATGPPSSPAATARWQEHRLVVTAALRQPGRLDDIVVQPLPAEPAVAQVAQWAKEIAETSKVWIAGGEPTLRSDLPALLAAVRSAHGGVGLCTDALALADPRALSSLRAAGLDRVRVSLHSGRADAHDWLVQQPGAARRAIQGIRRCRAEGVEVEIEAVITRPTMPHLAELCELGAHLGASMVHLRRLVARGPAARELIMLSARMAQLGTYLEDAAATAERRGLGLALHGLSHCVAPALDGLRVRSEQIQRRLADDPSWRSFRAALDPPASRHHCPSCPGEPRCEGTGADYVARFGGGELHSEDDSEQDWRPPGAAAGDDVVLPPGRAARAPATRLRQVVRQAAIPLAGDPLAPRAPLLTASTLRVRFAGPAPVACASCADGSAHEPFEPTRTIRQRLVRAAQEGATVLRIASAGSLSHPAAPRLLAETRLLGFERIEVAGEGSALAAWSEPELRALSFLHRLDVALYGPDAARHDGHAGREGGFDAALRGLQRVADTSGIHVGVFAVLHDEQLLADFARAWSAGRLPGSPAFRLSPDGGSLRALASAAGALPDGPARRAIEPLLPPCLLARATEGPPQADPGCAYGEVMQPQEPPSGSDRVGQLQPCACESAELRRRCPGIAAGWQLDLS